MLPRIVALLRATQVHAAPPPSLPRPSSLVLRPSSLPRPSSVDCAPSSSLLLPTAYSLSTAYCLLPAANLLCRVLLTCACVCACACAYVCRTCVCLSSLLGACGPHHRSFWRARGGQECQASWPTTHTSLTTPGTPSETTDRGAAGRATVLLPTPWSSCPRSRYPPDCRAQLSRGATCRWWPWRHSRRNCGPRFRRTSSSWWPRCWATRPGTRPRPASSTRALCP